MIQNNQQTLFKTGHTFTVSPFSARRYLGTKKKAFTPQNANATLQLRSVLKGTININLLIALTDRETKYPEVSQF